MVKFRAICSRDIAWGYDTVCHIILLIFLFVTIVMPSIGGLFVILWLITQWMGVFLTSIVGIILFIIIYKGIKIIPIQED